MLKNYSNNDKKIAIKLKKILKNNYKPVENVDGTNLNTNQTDNQADFLALRIIDNLIRFNQSFRLSQVPIKANMGKYNKKGGMIEQESKSKSKKEKYRELAKKIKQKQEQEQEQKEEKELKEKEKSKAKDTKIAQGLLDNIIKDAVKKADKVKKEQKARDTKNALENITKVLDKKADKVKKEEEEEEAKKKQKEEAKKQKEEAKKEQEEKAKKQKDLEELENKLNEFDGDNRFPSSFESLISAYGLMESINRNYRDLRPIFNNLSVPVYNDLNDVLDETSELIKKSIKTFHLGKVSHMQKIISNNIDDYKDKFNKIVSTFDNIYNDFQQRKQTFNTNIKTGSGFDYLTKIRNI